MEQRLGLGSKPQPSAAVTPTTAAGASDIDRQLQELEARVGGSGGTAA